MSGAIEVDQTSRKEVVKRVEYLVHWLPKAPDDHSRGTKWEGPKGCCGGPRCGMTVVEGV